MDIGNEVKIELTSNFVNSVSNSIFDYVTYDIWSNISSKIWNPVLIANNSSNELIQ